MIISLASLLFLNIYVISSGFSSSGGGSSWNLCSVFFSTSNCYFHPGLHQISTQQVLGWTKIWNVIHLHIVFPLDALCSLKFIPSISSQSGSSKLYLDAWGIRLVFSMIICLTLSGWWVLSEWRYYPLWFLLPKLESSLFSI